MKLRVLLVSLALLLIGTSYLLRPEPVTVTLHALRDPETVFWSGQLASPRVRDFHYFRAALMNHYRYPPLPFPERVRYRVSLRMQLLVEESGPHDFELVSPWFGALELDGERVFGSGPLSPGREPRGTITLAPGVHEAHLLLQPSAAGTGGVRLLWKPPNERLRDVGPGDLQSPSSPRLHRLGSGLSSPLLWSGGLVVGFVVIGWVLTSETDSLGCYGNEEVATPAIDGLAREGVLFENAFAQSSWTRPSITTILTGLYPGAHSVLGRQHRLAQNLTLLPEILRQRGYRTGFITTNPNVGSFFGFDQGWDTLQELYERRDEGHVRSTELITRSDTVTTAAIDWIGQAAQPFFLLILAVDPHWPYQPPERFDRYARAAPGDRERMRGLYHGEVAANDDSFGKLLAHLRDRKLYDDMVLVFTSDHGEEFWEHDERGHGKALYEESIRIPLVIRAPSFGEGQRIDRPVQSVDIMPTLLTLAGLPIPSPMDGQPIPMTATEATPVFSRLLHDNQNLAAIRDYPWKLIWNRETDEKQLFNLAEDPAELTPVTNQNGEMERLAHRLFQHAAQNLARRESLNKNVDPETVSEETIPDNVRETLKALGYVQ